MSGSLRADAQANHDRLLEVAARTIAQKGADATLKAIAAEAGVGIGTLYRRFPTREDLIEAIYRNETARLCASAAELLEARTPLAALHAWMEAFIDYMLTKQGMADALPAILATREGLRLHSREALGKAVATLSRRRNRVRRAARRRIDRRRPYGTGRHHPHQWPRAPKGPRLAPRHPAPGRSFRAGHRLMAVPRELNCDHSGRRSGSYASNCQDPCALTQRQRSLADSIA